jgi:hypothetical protein
MKESAPTLIDIFTINEKTPEEQHPDNWKLFQDKLQKEIKGIKWTASLRDIALKLADLLDISIPDILTNCWKKSEELKKILDESTQSPEEKFELILTEHSIVSEHKPYIELRFNNAPIYKIKFDINVFFNLNAFIVKIQRGEIYQIDSGQCEVNGTVVWEGIKLLEKKLEPLKLPTLIILQ